MTTRERGRLFEYAILLHPITEDTTKAAPPSKILVEPTVILAASVDEAQMVAARAIPEAYIERLQEVEIAVRPF